MNNRRNLIGLLVSLFVLVLMQGCTFNTLVKPDSMEFREQKEKLPLSVGLFLSADSRNYVISLKRSTETNNFMLGDALEDCAVQSLGKVFREVSVFHEKNNIKSNIDRIVSINFGPDTKIKLGPTGFSEHTVTVELICEIYDSKWNLLWRETSFGNFTERSGGKETLGLMLTPFAAHAIFQNRLAKMAGQSLILSLEQLNNLILTSGKDIILKSGQE